MKHTRAISKNPSTAASLVETSGLITFIGQVIGILTSALNFWNLLALPPNEVNNDGKGI